VTRRDHSPRRYPRSARVNEVVREVLADELERLSDPRLGFVTLTEVEVSADLRNATVYYSVLGSGEAHEHTAKALRSAGSHLRWVLGRQVRLKYLPRLAFEEDPAVAQGQRVEEVIRSLHEHPVSGRPRPSDTGPEQEEDG
jgi:ribosome-binding factor A